MTHKMKMQEQLEEVLLIMAEKGLIPYKDGNQWCILLGPNLQEGICGFGYTIIDAMMDFYQEAKAEGIIRNEEQKSAEDKTIEDVISYLNDGMCFNSQIEELKYRSNLANRLKSLRPSWKPSEEDIKMLEHIIGQYETGNKNSKVMGYLPRVEELNFLKKILDMWKN